MFSLPFLNFLKGWLMGVFFVTLIGSAGVYAVSYGVQRIKFDFARPVLLHIGSLVTFILGLFAWGYWLGIWDLVYSERGVVYGASYADMHSKLPAQWILLGVVVLVIILVIISIWRRNYRLPMYGIGAWVIAAIIVGSIYPAIVQRFQVQPNELARETTYIDYNLPIDADVSFVLYNLLGQIEKIINLPSQSAGNQTVMWDGTDNLNQSVATGIYFYRIESGDFINVKKMMLLK